MSSDLRDLSDQLNALAEQLADLAIDCLRRAADPDDPRAAAAAAAEERRITRARRAVEKAAVLLIGKEGDRDD